MRNQFGLESRALDLVHRFLESGDGEDVAPQRLDALLDDLYRRNFHPGPARGWPLELAEALRSSGEGFHPRDARHHAIPMLLSAWAREVDVVRLRLGLRLSLPAEMRIWLALIGHDRVVVSLRNASAEETIPADTVVEVTAVDGLILRVRRAAAGG